MKRRDLLKGAFYSTALFGAAFAAGFPFPAARAASNIGGIQKTLIKLMLEGGADLRFLFVPQPGSAYAAGFWEARKSLYQNDSENTARYPTYESVWADLYFPVTSGGVTFGIHRNAGWLRAQIESGNVAIICNALTSDTRRHDHSQLKVHAGDFDAGQFVIDRDGWGGRLVSSIGNASVVPVSNAVPIFCNGADPGNRTENVVHAKDIRSFALPNVDSDPTSAQSVLSSALRDYYEQRGTQIEALIDSGDLPEAWPYRRFFQHERVLKDLGDQLVGRFSGLGRPQAFDALFSGATRLNSPVFARECANIYDCFLAQDILKFRSMYLEYTGWDTHRNEKPRIEANFSDVFGAGGGLAVLSQELDNITGANDNIVYTITTDFGRQLAANAAFGSDHGRGNYMIVVGQPVRGGVYGDMFPQREILPGTDNATPFQQLGADIQGMTSFERVLSATCDWLEPGTGAVVFPKAATRMLEPGVDLGQLFQV